MARRKIKSQPFTGEQNFNQSDVLQNLSGLADMATLLQDQEMEGDVDLTGTAQEMAIPDQFQFPQVPRNPEMFEDEVGVDDVPGIPEGIELLGDLAGVESREDALDDVADPEPPLGMGAFTLPRTSSGALQDPLEFIRMRIQEEPELAQYLPEETRQMLEASQAQPEKEFAPPSREFPELPDVEEEVAEVSPGMIQEEVISEQPALPPAVEALPDQGTGQEVSQDDIPEEGLGAMPGAVEAAQQNPDLVRNVENLLNLKRGDIPKEAWEHAQLMEKALTQEEANLNELEKEYREKIERGELSTFDKVALGIAIALPVIIGMVYGKDALFATLGGSAKGFGEALMKQQESGLKTLGKIGEIQKEKKGITEKRAKLKEDYLKNVENPAVRKLLKNYDVINMTEGANGEPQITIGKDAMVIGDTIGLSGGDESGVLWYDTNQIRDDDDVKNFKTAVKEGKVALGKMKDANRTIDDVIDIMSVIKEQQPGLYNTFIQKFQPAMYTDESSWKSLIPGTAKAMTIEVVGEDGQVRTVQALPVLRQKITALQDVYNKEYLGGNRLTSNMHKHWNDVFPDASAVSSWLKSDYNTMVQQAQNFKNVLNQRAVESLSAEGFLREPLEKILPVKGGDILRSASIDMQDIEENPEKYRSKVKK